MDFFGKKNRVRLRKLCRSNLFLLSLQNKNYQQINWIIVAQTPTKYTASK